MNRNLHQMPTSDRKETVSSIPYLEPRVAKLEVGMERLTDDVRDLAGVVRAQGSNMEQEIQKLVVAVTQAAGPRKTDWSTIIAAVMLVLAIGSAAFWPLNQTSQENKQGLVRMEEMIDSHVKVANHPVGEALIQRLEEQLKLVKENHEKDMTAHNLDARQMHDTLRTHFHEELDLLTKTYELQLKALESKVDLHNDRLFNRVVKLEDQNRLDMEREKDELQQWRQKAMGLNSSGGPSVHSHLDAIPPQK
jgi:hypothetical protein